MKVTRIERAFVFLRRRKPTKLKLFKFLASINVVITRTTSKKMTKCFCCHEKASEYDEYDDLLGHCETRGQMCVILDLDFQANMLSESVSKRCICRYFEENCT